MARPSLARSAALKHGWRSGLEGKVADQLTGAGIAFDYEGERIEYIKPARTCKYTPDFPIVTRSGRKIYVETKGRFLIEDRQKHVLIRAQRPDLDIRFVFTNPATRISKTSKTTYADWCKKHGFLYAKALIPEEWLS